MDATEVTRAAYAEWLANDPDPADQDSGCRWNDDFEPDPSCMNDASCAGSDDDCPAVCVDWCDALAYCRGQGKRLCGKIGGGMVPFNDYADPGKSEWTNACSAGGQYEYGHGHSAPDTEPTACVYSGNSGGTAYPVGTRAACVSPSPGYATLRDLSGNVAEWEDSCEKAASTVAASATDACRTRGGSFQTGVELLKCTTAPAVPLRRNEVSASVGIRCCRD